MENLYNNTDIRWVQVTDPSTGYIYYVPTTSLYNQKNGGTYSQVDGVYISNTLINAIVYTGSFSDSPYIEFYKGDGTSFIQSLSISSASSSFAVSASYADYAATSSYIDGGEF